MCGIAGGIGPSAPSLESLEAQLTKLEHRGPDDRGTYVNQGIALGMCRLAIVEIAAGKQPFESVDGKIKIVDRKTEFYKKAENIGGQEIVNFGKLLMEKQSNP